MVCSFRKQAKNECFIWGKLKLNKTSIHIIKRCHIRWHERPSYRTRLQHINNSYIYSNDSREFLVHLPLNQAVSRVARGAEGEVTNVYVICICVCVCVQIDRQWWMLGTSIASTVQYWQSRLDNGDMPTS